MPEEVTTEPGELRGLTLVADDLNVLAHFAETGVSLVRAQMMSGAVPEIHLSQVNHTCKRGDAVIEKVRKFLGVDDE